MEVGSFTDPPLAFRRPSGSLGLPPTTSLEGGQVFSSHSPLGRQAWRDRIARGCRPGPSQRQFSQRFGGVIVWRKRIGPRFAGQLFIDGRRWACQRMLEAHVGLDNGRGNTGRGNLGRGQDLLGQCPEVRASSPSSAASSSRRRASARIVFISQSDIARGFRSRKCQAFSPSRLRS